MDEDYVPVAQEIETKKLQEKSSKNSLSRVLNFYDLFSSGFRLADVKTLLIPRNLTRWVEFNPD